MCVHLNNKWQTISAQANTLIAPAPPPRDIRPTGMGRGRSFLAFFAGLLKYHVNKSQNAFFCRAINCGYLVVMVFLPQTITCGFLVVRGVFRRTINYGYLIIKGTGNWRLSESHFLKEWFNIRSRFNEDVVASRNFV